MSLTGRSTCVSASALSLDAQPAQVESVVRRISRPVFGIGIVLLNQNDRQPDLAAGHFTLLVFLITEGLWVPKWLALSLYSAMAK
jgi:hypothetical protein